MVRDMPYMVSFKTKFTEWKYYLNCGNTKEEL